MLFFISTEHTTVQFTPDAFRDPYLYLATTETVSTVDRYELYMTGTSNQNPGFQVKKTSTRGHYL